MSPWRGLLSFLSPAGAGGRLSILIFHRVLPRPDPVFTGEVDVAAFDRIVGWLRDGFRVLPLDAAVQALRDGKLPARAAAITFDDGYADNHTQALPVLQRHRVSATFFIASGFLDGGRMWNDTVIESVRHCAGPVLDLSPLDLGRHAVATPADKRVAIGSLLKQIKYTPAAQRVETTRRIAELARVQPSDALMMRSEQVLALHRAGMQIGAHTVNHPILARVDPDTARREIGVNREHLQGITGSRIGLFAYPNGRPGSDYTELHARLVEELGFDAAVSTAWGAATAGTDLYQLPRFTPWDRSGLKFRLRLTNNLRHPGPLRATADGALHA